MKSKKDHLSNQFLLLKTNMQKKLTLTIGIPAYNEEGNIGTLIRSLLNQNCSKFILERILIVSDASTDRTDAIVKEFKNKKVNLVRNYKRKGVVYSQNIILGNVKSDILVLINADVTIRDSKCINKLVEPFLDSPDIGIVGAKVIPLPAENWFSAILNHSHTIKQYIYENLDKDKNTIYLCHGRARAFSKKCYKNFRFLPFLAEDAYSYLRIQELNLKFVFEPRAKVFFKSPANLKDHLGQSVRFIESKKQIEEDFIKREEIDHFKIPLTLYMRGALKGFFSHPVQTAVYSFILVISYIAGYLRMVEVSQTWSISKSSK